MSSSKVSAPVASLQAAPALTKRSAAALTLLPALLSAAPVEAAERVCDLVCTALLALLCDDASEAREVFARIVAPLDATPLDAALFELVFTAALGVCPAYALEDLDRCEWGEEPIHEAVCAVTTACRGLDLQRHPGRPAPNPPRARQ